MNTWHAKKLAVGLLALGLVLALPASADGYQQVVDGVAIYFGIVPAELVRGHPREHPEGEMHGGAPVGENHLMIALFDDKTGRRIVGAEVTARITGDGGLNVRKKLESMVMAGAASFGNYFYMPGAGPYRIEIEVRVPGRVKPVIATFTWVRS
jgi:hypothetical protein